MSTRRVPELLVEKLRLGELDSRSAADVRARLEAAGETARLLDLDASDAEVLAALPPDAAAKEISRRFEASLRIDKAAADVRERRRRGAMWMLPALAGAAVVAIAVGRGGGEPQQATSTGQEGLEQTRLKGLRPVLHLYRKDSGGTKALASGDVARDGDLIQIAYVSGGKKYGVILSIDGRGQTTRHLWEEGFGRTQPAVQDGPSHLSPHGETMLDHSYQLDDAPAFERFFFVTSDTRFEMWDVEAPIRRLGLRPLAASEPLVLPPGFEQASILLRKDHP